MPLSTRLKRCVIATAVLAVICFAIVPSLLKLRDSFAIEDVSPEDILFGSDFAPEGAIVGYPRLPELKPNSRLTMYLPRYRLHQCFISKNMETAGGAVFCYLSNSSAYSHLLESRKDWKPGQASRPCSQKRAYLVDKAFQKTNVTHLVVLRHPVKRLLSGYLHVCRERKHWCYGCPIDDFHCFLQRNYEQLQALTLNEYHKRAFNFEYHFYPQTWFCGLDKFSRRYTKIVYEANEVFVQKYLNVLRSVGVPGKQLRLIEAAVQRKSSIHATDKSTAAALAKSVYRNQTLLRLVVLSYFQDFRQLGFAVH